MERQHFDVNYYFVYCRQKPTFYQFMILQSVLPVYFAISFAWFFTAKYLYVFQYLFMHVVCANIFGAIVLKPRFKIDTVFGTWLGMMRITWGKSPEWLFRYLRFSKRATVGVRATYATRWNSGMKRVGVDERNLYSTRSAIIGLAVETWRVKTELKIITILHIIIITASILNLGFKTIAPKILAHITCINRYWNTYKY